jgi:outer membrane lipoprotein SlyB
MLSRCLPAAPNNRGTVFSARSANQQLNSNKGTVFSVRPVPICYNQDNWSNELAVGQSSAGKKESTEAEDIVGICHQATTAEDIAN